MEKNIPEFMQGYYDGGNEEVREAIAGLAAKYEDERATFFQTTYIQKKAFEKDWNKMTGSKHNLTPEQAIEPINRKYEEQVKELALNYNDKEKASQQEVHKHREQQQEKPDKPQMTRNQFLQNLQSIRERAARHTHRPRQ